MKRISILGDSISTLEGYNQLRAAEFYDGGHKLLYGVHEFSDTWWGKLINHLGGELLVNDSYSGTMIARDERGMFLGPSAVCGQRLESLAKNGVMPDVIIIFMGFNDWENGIAIEADSDDLKENLSCFKPAYRYVLDNLKEKYPDAEIMALALPKAYLREESDSRVQSVMEPPDNHAAFPLPEYNEVIREAAISAGCKFIDIAERRYETLDMSHPTKKGMEEIFDAIISCI